MLTGWGWGGGGGGCGEVHHVKTHFIDPDLNTYKAVVLDTGLDQQHGHVRIFAQARSHDSTGTARSHDNVVVRVGNGNKCRRLLRRKKQGCFFGAELRHIVQSQRTRLGRQAC